jgi:predicted permease
MMHFWGLLQSIATMLGLVALSFLLKKRGVICASHSQVLSRIVTDFALPALILLNLSQNQLTAVQLIPALIMLVSTFMSLFLGWLLGKYFLHLPNPKLGSFIMICGFGSSSTLGYALIAQIFPGSVPAISQAMLVSEFGAVIPVFTAGVAISSYFGAVLSGEKRNFLVIKNFFSSPIFFSVCLGLILSFLPIPMAHPVVKVVYAILKIAGNSLEALVALSIGLMLTRIPFRQFSLLIIAVLAIKLIGEPLLAYFGAHIFAIGNLPREILIIESAMPSGALAALIAVRYGCDKGVASVLTVATYIISLLTLPFIFFFLGT